jgi:hypothetical protein
VGIFILLRYLSDMDIIITDKQFDKLVPREHIEFVKAWKKRTGSFPRFRVLQQSGEKVKDTLPTHPLGEISTKTYVDRYLGKFLNGIISKLSIDSGETLDRKRGSKNYPTADGKLLLRSELEVMTYNIFWLHGVSDKIDVDSRKFKKVCAGKEPDFVWEEKKIIIEIAGMTDEGYKEDLKNAEECFNNLGYKTYIIWDDQFRINRYVKFYNYLCKLLGFTPMEEVLKNPLKFLLSGELTKEQKQKFIDDNIDKIPYSSNLYQKLSRYINQLHGETIGKYKLKRGLKYYEGSVGSSEIKKFKEENPTLSYPEIAKRLGVSKNTVGRAIRGDIQKKYYQTKG